MTTAAVATPVLCQNEMAGPTVIASDLKATYEVTFAGKGSPDGEDVKPVPPEIVSTVQFSRAISQGVLRVLEGADNPVVVKALERQTGTFRQRMEVDQIAAREHLDAPQEDEMVAVACIGPGTRPDTKCEENVVMRARETGSRPPLCTRHEGLAEQCVKRGRNPWVLEGVA
jgi:hypothetical protein